MKHTLIRTLPEAANAGAFSGCGHGPAPAARRLANAPPIKVNGVLVAESAIAQEAQNHSAASAAEARAAAARALVIRELLMQRARALGLRATPGRDCLGREETSEEALVRQVLALEAPAPAASEAECRRVYGASISRFTAPALYEASHILFAPGEASEVGWATAQACARRAIEALAAGADFADWARAHSACLSAREGGNLGRLTEGDLAPEIESAVLALAPGQIGAAPVRTRYGWHVIRLERCTPARPLPFEAVAAIIAEGLHARASIAAAARYIERLAAAADLQGISLSFGALP